MNRQQFIQRLNLLAVILVVAGLLTLAWIATTLQRAAPMKYLSRLYNSLYLYTCKHPFVVLIVQSALIVALATFAALVCTPT